MPRSLLASPSSSSVTARLGRDLVASLLALAPALSLAGCAAPLATDTHPMARPAASAAPAPRLAPPTPSAASAAPLPAPPAWSEDAVEAATAEAKSTGALLLVDAWAPWCHTCLSMKREVLSSPELGAYRGRVVFAAIDTDRPSSNAFVGRYAVEVWPTFFVIDPSADRVLAVHGGSASLEELKGVLDGALALRRSPDAGAFETALHEGAAAYAARDFRAALVAYRRAAEMKHPRASEAQLGAIRSAFESRDVAACVELAKSYLDKVSGSAMAADFTYYARDCATKLPEGAARTALLLRTLERLRAMAADPPASSTIDDRADALAMLAEAEREGGDREAARAAIDRRIAMLDAAAAAARSPREAAAYDYMRMRAYEDAGRPGDAVAMLEARTREMPDDYEPFARLASVLAKTDPRRALVPLKRALELSYGPRRLRYLELQAKIYLDLGDRAGRAAALKELVAAMEAAPRGVSPKELAERRAQAAAAARDAGAPPPPTAGAPSPPVKAPGKR